MVYDVVYIDYIVCIYICMYKYIKWKHLKLSLIWYIVIFDGHVC